LRKAGCSIALHETCNPRTTLKPLFEVQRSPLKLCNLILLAHAVVTITITNAGLPGVEELSDKRGALIRLNFTVFAK